jgi:hypothetical protein
VVCRLLCSRQKSNMAAELRDVAGVDDPLW